MIQELDSVVLTKDIPEHHLKAGDTGAVVLVYGKEEAYEVEFVALNGETFALVTLYPHQVRPARKGELSHARGVA